MSIILDARQLPGVSIAVKSKRKERVLPTLIEKAARMGIFPSARPLSQEKYQEKYGLVAPVRCASIERLMERHEALIKRSVLDNGLVVLTEQMNHVRSASIGIWVRSGSRHESPDFNGISHFIEHTLFKGTTNRTAREIAVESDAIGGNVDAFTSREVASYYVKVLDEHIPRSFDLLADLVTAPLFTEEELDRERNVVIEEINMVEDTPDDLVHEVFVAKLWPDHPLGRSILGTAETLSTFDHDRVADHFANVYGPSNLVVSAAGNLDHDEFLEMVEGKMGSMAKREIHLPTEPPNAASHRTVINKQELEQAHFLLGAKCPSMISEDRFSVHVMNIMLGGGMSSRLFQKIREERGLAYSVFSGVNAFTDTGYLSIYAATSPDQLTGAIELAMEELAKIKVEDVSSGELQRAKDQLKVSLMLGLESTSSRMSNLARQEIFYNHHSTLDEILARVEAVTIDDVKRVASEIFRSDEFAITALGPLGDLDLDKVSLAC